MLSCTIPDRREIELHTEVSAELRSSIEALFASQKTLEDVVRWGLAQTPARIVEEVVVQDEYTHDVVLRHPSGVYLAYDTT
jgi:hypothetical protein